MHITITFDECNNTELIEKMKQIKNYGEFVELANEYGWNECIAAFNTAIGFDADYIEEQFFDAFYLGYDMTSIIEYAINNILTE